jgi:hypothetical protein
MSIEPLIDVPFLIEQEQFVFLAHQLLLELHAELDQ